MFLVIVFYTAAKKRAFAKTLQMKRVILPAVSVFVGPGHVQRLKDAIPLAYGASFIHVAQCNQLIPRRR